MRALMLEETYRLDAQQALNVARGVAVGQYGDPQAYKALVEAATGSKVLGEISRYRAEVAKAKAEQARAQWH